MSKKILVVESDSGFSKRLKGDLEGRGFAVVETQDGKAAFETAKREVPDLVILAVELSAGQSGYIICGKLKKDDATKRIPVIIVGKDAEGFEGHKKLRTRAEEYLKKPFDTPELLGRIKDLIGLPERAEVQEVAADADESLSLQSLGVDAGADGSSDTLAGDPDLEMLDAAFDGIAGEKPESAEGEPPAPKEDTPFETDDSGREQTDSFRALDALDSGDSAAPADSSEADVISEEVQVDEDVILEALEPVAEESMSPGDGVEARSRSRPPPPPNEAVGTAPADQAEINSLRERISELETKLADAESKMTSAQAELDGIRASSGNKDKDFFALREQVTKRDKEILKLKEELHEKDKELVDVNEKLTDAERKSAASGDDLIKRDAQIKTLTQRVDQLLAEKKKTEQSTQQARDEARQMATRLATAQGELDQAKEQAQGLGAEVDELKGRVEKSEKEAAEFKADAEKTKELEQTLQKSEGRVAELEGELRKNEERVVKAYQKIKTDEKLREKTKKAINIALQLIDEQPALDEGPEAEVKEDAVS
jgi:CheY-like chemotaxis protein